MKKEVELERPKKEIKENEASMLRWLATVVVGFIIGSFVFGTVLTGIMYIVNINVPALGEGGSWHEYSTLITLVLNSACLFWGTVIAIRIVAKTSIKSFVLGSGRNIKLNIKKEVLPIAGLSLLGIIVFSSLPFINNISRNNITATQISFVIIFSLLFTWMQTSWEEFVFRGVTLRITCKDDIGFNKKSIIGCVISSVLFMLMHVANPEVLSLSGIDVVFMTLSYLVPGVLLYVFDVMCGNLLPGLIIHYVNNFFNFALISEVVSAGGTTSIWIDYSNKPGFVSMITVILANVPVLIYLIMAAKKRANGDGYI